MTLNFKDLRVGALFVAIGLFFGLYAYGKITMGTPARMGPGFFPVALSILLVALGLAICVQALRAAPSAMALVPWRALVLVLAAPVFFGLMIDRLGFAPTVAVTALIAAFASRDTGWRRALVIAAGLTALCVTIFIYGLGIPLRLFGPWLVG
jgi:hypothetical protein